MTLVDFLVLHRARTEEPDETTRLTLVGQSAGRPRQAMQRVLAVLGCWLVVQTSLVLSGVDMAFVIAIPVLALGFLPLARGAMASDRPSGAVGLWLTDRRAVVAQERVGGEVRILAEMPPDRLRWARLERVDGLWVPGGLLRVEVGDDQGPVLAMDLPQLSALTAQLTLEESGLQLLPSTTVAPHRDPAGRVVADPRLVEPARDLAWAPRTAGIVLGLLFGLLALVAGVSAAVAGAVGVATTALVVAIVALAGAAALIASRPGRRAPAVA